MVKMANFMIYNSNLLYEVKKNPQWTVLCNEDAVSGSIGGSQDFSCSVQEPERIGLIFP
jgi:hypothetical protein